MTHAVCVCVCQCGLQHIILAVSAPIAYVSCSMHCKCGVAVHEGTVQSLSCCCARCRLRHVDICDGGFAADMAADRTDDAHQPSIE
jgi:hypothetical protein